MNITITTDASFSSKYKRGTYAFFITSNLGRMSQAGALRKSCRSPSEAEIKCIINALTFVRNNKELFDKCKNVYVNTDSMNSIHIWNDDRQLIIRYKLFKLSLQLNKLIRKLKKDYRKKSIELRHVKGHSGVNDKRSYVNEFCDKAAKVEMGILINKIEGNESNKINKR